MTVEREMVGRFIDAAVNDPKAALAMLAANPTLRQTPWNLGQTALHFLAVEGFTDSVELCLTNGFDPNATNEFGDTPLIDACVLEHESIVRLLIEHGADVNVVSKTNDCPLHCCLLNGDAKLLDLLLSAGSNPYYTTDLGETIFDNWPADAETQKQLGEVLSRHGVSNSAK